MDVSNKHNPGRGGSVLTVTLTLNGNVSYFQITYLVQGRKATLPENRKSRDLVVAYSNYFHITPWYVRAYDDKLHFEKL